MLILHLSGVFLVAPLRINEGKLDNHDHKNC